MKQYVKRWAALVVLALGGMSAQAKAANVALNLSGAGVQVVVNDNCKHVKKYHKVAKNHGAKMDRRKAMARHRVDKRRFDDRGKKVGKGKR